MKKSFYVILTLLLLTGCISNNRVTRINSDIQTDLSGRWNDTDSRLLSQYMVNEILNRNISDEFLELYKKKPVLVVGQIRNISSEHINTVAFVKDIERELVNSGKFRVVASSDERLDIRSEKEDQQSNSSMNTAKKLAYETGADIMLYGNISTILDQVNKTRVIYYQIDLEIVNLETNEKIWIGTKKHKKIIDLGGVKW